jgi:hypothetical protein
MFEKGHDQDSLFEIAVRAIIDGLYMRMSGNAPDLGAR